MNPKASNSETKRSISGSFEFILQEAISLRKDSRNIQLLFTNHEKYLARRVEVES
jgi:hypothetical protein